MFEGGGGTRIATERWTWYTMKKTLDESSIGGMWIWHALLLQIALREPALVLGDDAMGLIAAAVPGTTPRRAGANSLAQEGTRILRCVSIS